MKRALTLIFLFISKFIFADETIEMATEMRSNGKIYIVVTILLIILIGFFAYLASVDRKLNKVINKLNNKN